MCVLSMCLGASSSLFHLFFYWVGSIISIGSHSHSHALTAMQVSATQILIIFSCVLPDEYIHGSVTLPEFPQWLSNSSKTVRNKRILEQLHSHSALKWDGDIWEKGEGGREEEEMFNFKFSLSV